MNRTVYGGGGIMPDYFVSMDTTAYSDYYRQLISKGIFNRFILQHVDDNRDRYLSDYPDFSAFKDNFEPDQDQIEALIAFAEEENLSFDQDQWDISGDHISMLLKAYMARDLWSMARFYQVYNYSNEVFNKAVEILNEPIMVSQKLGKAFGE